jgi:hypothetical protein
MHAAAVRTRRLRRRLIDYARNSAPGEPKAAEPKQRKAPVWKPGMMSRL